ncbi:MAG: hypothetical protein L0Z50_12065 [Verrucomicrobiales bacterium]|nr:hypothetical protein [Verrucomicrobiales bacterium]
MRDGTAGGGLRELETIKAANADNTFIFGNQIINTVGEVAEQAIRPAGWRNYGELTIDTTVLTANGHALTLDFTNVSRAMEFVFENTGTNEVQELIFGTTGGPTSPGVGDQFRLIYGVQELQRLTLSGTAPTGSFTLTVRNPGSSVDLITDAVPIQFNKDGVTIDTTKTAEQIRDKINAKLSDPVTVTPVANHPHAWDITFANKGDYNPTSASNPTGGTSTMATIREGVLETTGNITIGSSDRKTAANIESALKTAVNGEGISSLLSDKVKFTVKTNTLTRGSFAVVIGAKSDVAKPQVIAPDPVPPIAPAWITTANGAVRTLTEGSSGGTKLTIEKRYNLPQFFDNSQIADLWNGYFGAVLYDRIVITNVDANTTIIGGSNENTFKIIGDANFQGTLIGQKVFRPLTSFADFDSISDILRLDFPNLTTINTVDFSDSSAKLPTITNLTHVLSKGAVDVFTVTDPRVGKEMQRLIIPTADAGAFKVSGLKADGTTPFETVPITLHTVAAATLDLTGTASGNEYNLHLQKDPLTSVSRTFQVGATDADTLRNLNAALTGDRGTATNTGSIFRIVFEGEYQGLAIERVLPAPEVTLTLDLRPSGATVVAGRIKQAIDAALGDSVEVFPLDNLAGAWDIEFQKARVDYALMSVASVAADPLRELIQFAATDVQKKGTAQGMRLSVDLSTAPAMVKFSLTVPGKAAVQTAPVATDNAAAIKSALELIIRSNTLAQQLGPITVTERTPAGSKIYDITFARGNAAIEVLNAATGARVLDGSVTQYAQSGWQQQELALHDANSGVLEIDYNIARPAPSNLAGSVLINFGPPALADLPATVAAALNAKLGATAVTVTGNATAGLIVTFNSSVVQGMVNPLTLLSRSLSQTSSPPQAPVGPVTVVRESIIHEVQQLKLTLSAPPTPASGTFRLSFVIPPSTATMITAPIAIGRDGNETAKNIQVAIDALLGQTVVKVTARDDFTWELEYLVLGDIPLAGVNADPTGGTLSVTDLVSALAATNSVQHFSLNGADSGSFLLQYGDQKTQAITVVAGTGADSGKINAFAIAGQIETRLEAKLLKDVIVTAFNQVPGGAPQRVTASGFLPAAQISFAVEIAELNHLGSTVIPAGFAVDLLKVDATGLTKTFTAGASIVGIEQGQRPVAEIQKLVVNNAGQAGAAFTLQQGATSTKNVAFTTASIRQNLALMTKEAQVTEGGDDAWFVTFTGAPGKDVPQIVMITDTASQVAQQVSVGDLRNWSFTQASPNASGFTGAVRNMSNVTYGAGLNLLLGSNVSIYEAGLAKISGVSSVNDLFADASFSLGKNVFSVGGNLFGRAFEDVRTRDSRYDSDSNARDFAKFLFDTFLSTAINGSLSFGEPTVAPGFHLMSGMTGGDTYKFEGLWIAAAVIEPPSIYAGVDLNFGFDTLDFSGVGTDMTFDIYAVSTDNLDYWQSVVEALGHPIPLSVGVNLILARNDAILQLAQNLAQFDDEDIDSDGFGFNFVLATGIENIIGSSGDNTFNFHGTARLDGVVDAIPSANLVFNYDDYDPANDYAPDEQIGGKTYNGVVVDGTAGVQYEIIPPVSVPWLGDFPGLSVNFGGATGVLGSRLAGLDLFIPASAGLLSPSNNGVNGISGIGGSARDDFLKGNDKDNRFDLGQGGEDLWIE